MTAESVRNGSHSIIEATTSLMSESVISNQSIDFDATTGAGLGKGSPALELTGRRRLPRVFVWLVAAPDELALGVRVALTVVPVAFRENALELLVFPCELLVDA